MGDIMKIIHVLLVILSILFVACFVYEIQFISNFLLQVITYVLSYLWYICSALLLTKIVKRFRLIIALILCVLLFTIGFHLDHTTVSLCVLISKLALFFSIIVYCNGYQGAHKLLK